MQSPRKAQCNGCIDTMGEETALTFIHSKNSWNGIMREPAMMQKNYKQQKKVVIVYVSFDIKKEGVAGWTDG